MAISFLISTSPAPGADPPPLHRGNPTEGGGCHLAPGDVLSETGCAGAVPAAGLSSPVTEQNPRGRPLGRGTHRRPARSTVALPPLPEPPPRKPAWPTLAALGIATGVAAVGLGAWTFVSGTSAPSPRRGPWAPASSATLAVLADSRAERYPLAGKCRPHRSRRRPAGPRGPDARRPRSRPEGSRYHAWLVPSGLGNPVAVAMFDGLGSGHPPSAAGAPRVARRRSRSKRRFGATRPSRTLRLVALRPH